MSDETYLRLFHRIDCEATLVVEEAAGSARSKADLRYRTIAMGFKLLGQVPPDPLRAVALRGECRRRRVELGLPLP